MKEPKETPKGSHRRRRTANQPHRARRLALQALCSLDVQGTRTLDLVRTFIDDSRETPQTISTAHAIVNRALEDKERVDGLLARHARNWELPRLALVDRNILRLGACELLGGATPVKIAITEALKLAQEFSTAESPRFINGVLDAVAKEVAGTPQREDPEANASQ